MPSVKWEDVHTVVVVVEGPENSYHLLKGAGATALTDVVRRDTEPSHGELQTHGGEIWLYAMDKNMLPMFIAILDVQWVEGMGGKTDPNPNWDELLKPQEERKRTALGIIEKRGERISADELWRYTRSFQGNPRMWLYWKK